MMLWKLPLLLALALATGFVQGVAHAWRFRMTGQVPTRVKVHWLLGRTVACTVAAWLLLPVAWWLPALGALVLTSTAFRYTMAADLLDRGWHPCYLGATSLYDRAWLWWQLGHDVGRDRQEHYRRYHRDALYRAAVLDAGRLAYACELIAAAIAFALFLIHTL